MSKRVPLLAAIVLLGILGGCTDDEALRVANAEIAKGNETIASLNDQITQQNEQLAAAEAAATARDETIAALNSEVSEGNATIAAFVESNAEWEQELAALKVAHDALAQDKAELETALADSDNLLGEKIQELASAREELASARESLAEVQSDLDVWRGEYGIAQALEKRVEELEAEIRELMEKRRPLILDPSDTFWHWHRCTGSMEPAYGCLDELLHLTDFQEGDITVGTIIGFRSPGCPGIKAATHRVVDIKVIDGQTHYWPKGDSNRRPDGCWVPHSDVNYYLIDIRRNVYPENAELRDLVNAAKAVALAAFDAREAADAAHDDVYIRHCGSAEPRCTLPSQAALDEAWAAWYAYENARKAAEETNSIYRCWSKVAEDSEGPGHIPRRC